MIKGNIAENSMTQKLRCLMSGVPLSKLGGARKFELYDGICSEFLLEFVEDPNYRSM